MAWDQGFDARKDKARREGHRKLCQGVWRSCKPTRRCCMTCRPLGPARPWPGEKGRCRANALPAPLAIYAAAPTPRPALHVADFGSTIQKMERGQESGDCERGRWRRCGYATGRLDGLVDDGDSGAPWGRSTVARAQILTLQEG